MVMNMNLNEELIMIISSCEAYSDLWGNHVIMYPRN